MRCSFLPCDVYSDVTMLRPNLTLQSPLYGKEACILFFDELEHTLIECKGSNSCLRTNAHHLFLQNSASRIPQVRIEVLEGTVWIQLMIL